MTLGNSLSSITTFSILKTGFFTKKGLNLTFNKQHQIEVDVDDVNNNDDDYDDDEMDSKLEVDFGRETFM